MEQFNAFVRLLTDHNLVHKVGTRRTDERGMEDEILIFPFPMMEVKVPSPNFIFLWLLA